MLCTRREYARTPSMLTSKKVQNLYQATRKILDGEEIRLAWTRKALRATFRWSVVIKYSFFGVLTVFISKCY
eukprot:UN06165